MALKRIITPEEHKKLSAHLQSEYKEADGAFVLDLTDYEDTTALKNAKDHEKKAREKAQLELKEAKAALIALTEERDGMLSGTIPKADAEKLRKSYDEKIAKIEKDLGDKVTNAHASLQTMLVDNVATTMATEIATAPKVLLPHIKSRLKAEEVDGKFVTRVLDAEGKPSALTVDDLKKEMLANKDFSGVLIGSKGSGAGGARETGGAGGTPKKIDFSKSAKEIAASLEASGKLRQSV